LRRKLAVAMGGGFWRLFGAAQLVLQLSAVDAIVRGF
jgi:hypothetical protein